MELLWTAFVLGLVGSLHCAVMCGPLVLAVTRNPGPAANLSTSRIVYHAGRITTYIAIGTLFGAVGRTFALAGLQRWISLLAGIAILLGLAFASRMALKTPVAKLVLKLKTAFARLLQRRGLAPQFTLGALNGLLPCGLVYIAAAGAATTLSPTLGALHMALFGAGTLPMMLGIASLGSRAFPAMKFRALVPTTIAVVGIMLVLRGLSLGIPYLSPDLANGISCH